MRKFDRWIIVSHRAADAAVYFEGSIGCPGRSSRLRLDLEFLQSPLADAMVFQVLKTVACLSSSLHPGSQPRQENHAFCKVSASVSDVRLRKDNKSENEEAEA
jgi:hypothetical protein